MYVEECFVEMLNGCICCMLCDDLFVEICNFVFEGCFDVIMIELIGIVELMLIVEIFMFVDDDGVLLLFIVWFDMFVIVVDVYNFLCDYGFDDVFVMCGIVVLEDDDCMFVELLIE